MQISNEAIGMMEGAFFVSKNDLLNWINKLLDVFLLTLYTL
jgi:hypothetical protein